jgi:diacylglycerol kinase (ATP)
MNKSDTAATRKKFTVAARLKSFSYAIQGIGFVLRTQHNAWLHLLATLGVIMLALFLGFTPDDWRWLIVAMAIVWIAETINTAMEHLCDVVSPHYAEAVKRAKDIAAGAVLISAAAALLIGVLTFLPYLKKLS